MPNVTRGGRMPGLLVYLAGDGRHNEHRDQHVVAGDPALMAWHADEQLDRASALAIAKHLDAPSRVFGTEVNAPLYEWSEERQQRVKVGYGDAHVWHCSLSLRAEEGVLPDSTWSQIAEDFVRQMGFTDDSGKAPCRWVAIRHGVSQAGNDHVHIAVNLVREDGTKATTWNDFRRAQEISGRLEKAYGLQVLESRELGLGSRGVRPAELGRAESRSARDTQRAALARRVRASATASRDEAEFVRRLRREGLLARPRYAAGRDDVVLGYSVALRPNAGERPVWFGGGTLAKDLTLPRLRSTWPDSPQTASDAVAEWTAAGRGQRPVRPGIEVDAPDPRLWDQYAEQIGELNERLRSVAPDDTATWTQVARETSGAFAAWSLRTEAEPGPLADASDALARYAQVRAGSAPSKQITTPAILGLSRVLLVAADRGQSRTSQAYMVRQLANTLHALFQMQQAMRHAQAAAVTEWAVRERLAVVAARSAAPAAARPAPVPGALSVEQATGGAGPRLRSPLPNPLEPRPRTTSAAQRDDGIER
ncbi:MULTISPECIES: relaxase/mobilization nuclease domain-containing protein [Cellulomonas]|nr:MULTISPECIES: relaxase/mobilization nuclease domain-containing protein [Cellulomonas]GIG26482.1 hypothetical protein Cde04nite_27260 [Cellulomonas denverensis]